MKKALDLNFQKSFLDYHRWRNIAPEKLAHPIEAKFSARVEDMALCNLCRKIRENREAGIRQYYKSVSANFKLEGGNFRPLDNEMVVVRCQSRVPNGHRLSGILVQN